MSAPTFPILLGFGLILFRALGLVLVVPVLSTRMVPPPLRLGIALIAAAAAFAGAGSPQVPIPASFFPLLALALGETVVGLAAGLAARVIFEAALAAGQVAGLGMGFGFTALVDPVAGVPASALGQLFMIAALGFSVALGLHREAIAWLARSVIAFPPGSAIDGASLAASVIGHALTSVALAVRLAFPILAVVTIGHLALGLVGRLAPQLNMATLGFSVAILAGGGAVYLVAPPAAELVARMAVEAVARQGGALP